MQHMNRFLKQLLIAGVVNTLGAGLLAAAPAGESIDASIQRAMETFDAPGMAVSIVKDGELFYSDGHGLVEIGSSKDVDDRTLLQIGSVSRPLPRQRWQSWPTKASWIGTTR
jgi:CubicO group peptidase (beta-lactamase class C family)